MTTLYYKRTVPYGMSLRCVGIPVKKDIRDSLKEIKGSLTWNDFFEKKVLKKELNS